MSLLPFGGLKPSPNPWLAEHYPASLITMGLTAERVARHYNITREDQDAFAYSSHKKALNAQSAGRFNEELIPVTVTTAVPGEKAGKTIVTERVVSADDRPPGGLRRHRLPAGGNGHGSSLRHSHGSAPRRIDAG
jgi:acetyl-CoA acyltransferase